MKENKYEWLYNNYVNGNMLECRDYMHKKSKKFLVEFIRYMAEYEESKRAIDVAWRMVK